MAFSGCGAGLLLLIPVYWLPEVRKPQPDPRKEAFGAAKGVVKPAIWVGGIFPLKGGSRLSWILQSPSWSEVCLAGGGVYVWHPIGPSWSCDPVSRSIPYVTAFL